LQLGTVPQPVTSARPGTGDRAGPQCFQTLAGEGGNLAEWTTSTSMNVIPDLYRQTIHTLPRRHPSSPLVLLKTGRDEPALFIVTGLGGTAADVFSLARNMRCSNPLYALQARGLDGAEAPLEYVRDLAQYHLAAVQARQPEGPYLLAGYSFGGLVALEIAQLLVQSGQRPALLAFLESYPHPRYWPRSVRSTIVARIAWARLSTLARSGPRHMFAYASERVDRLNARMHARQHKENADPVFRWFHHTPPSGTSPVAQRVYTSCVKAFARYRPELYPGNVVFFQPRVTTSFPSNPARIWQKLVRQLQVQSVAGDHLSMVGADSEDLAARLCLCISSSLAGKANCYSI
jgi:acetoacetyl-CoA synthetase